MKKWITISLLSLVPLLSWGQEVILSANHNPVGESEPFVLSITIDRANGEYVLPENLEQHFRILSGVSTSSQRSFVNGRISASQTWSVQVMPKRKGTFRLEPAKVKLDSESYESNGLTIQVVADTERPVDPNSPEEIAKILTFMDVSVSKQTAYVGEPISVKYNLFGLVEPGPLEFQEKPEWEGFIRENIEQQNAVRLDPEVRNGHRYARWNLESFVLVPQRDGTFQFDPLITIIPTPVNNNRMLWGRQMVNNINSAKIPRITIKPLPTENKPSGFTGAVGTYNLDVSLSRDSIETNESVTLTVKLTGKGNLNTLELPEVQLPAQIKVFGPTKDNRITPSSNGIRGSISNEYILVPHYGGTYKIPAIEFSYFDPSAEQYVTLTSEELEFNVWGNNVPTTVASGEDLPTHGSPAATHPEKLEVEVLNEDIRWIHQHSDSSSKPIIAFWKTTWFGLGTATAFLASMWILFAGSISNWKKGRSNTLQSAIKVAQKELIKAHSWKELHLLFSTLLKNGYKIPYAQQVRDLLPKSLMEKGLDEDHGKRAHQLLAECEAGQFGTSLRPLTDVKLEMENWMKSVKS